MQQRQITQAEQELSTIWQAQLQAARQQPWLAGLILKRARQFWQRVSEFYRFLSHLPRRRRRRLQRKLAGGLLGAALLLAAGPTPSVQAATIMVNHGAAGIQSGDGCSLVEAIINANDGAQTHAECTAGSSGADTIVLSGYTYSYTTSFTTSPVNTFTALPDITSSITIEGNGATIKRTGSDEFRILKVTTASGDLTLNDATISGGYFKFFFETGGGLLVEDEASVTINDSTISGNSWGAVSSPFSSVTTITINNSSISDNVNGVPPNTGYGVVSSGGTLTINNSTISNNTGQGVLSEGTLIIDDSTISNNHGGVIGYRDVFTINNSTISGNTSTGVNSSAATGTINNSAISDNATSGRGGGVRISGGTTTINDSTISGNAAVDDGGGVYISFGTGEINNSTISGNAASSGGGVSVYQGTGTINNSTISGNAAVDDGGGIYNVSGTTTVNDSTISGNTASSGGGIRIFQVYSATLNLNRSLISGNTASEGAEIYSGGNYGTPTINADNYNLFGHNDETEADAFKNFAPGEHDWVATSDNTSQATLVSTALTDILDTTLADNGGPTLTHALVTGSPALDKIESGFPDTDQRGVPRPQPQGEEAKADIGAFERVEPQQGIIGLQDDLQTLVDDSVLKPGQANGLIHPLDNAEQSLDDGRPEDACNQLDDFIAKVKDKTPEPLDADTAAGLIVYAEAIQSSIGCQ